MRAQTLAAGVAVGVVLSAHGGAALAHSAGQPGPGCIGCHGAGDYAITASANPASFSPGAEVNVTVTISPSSGQNAGIFIAAKEGVLGAVGGQGLALVPNGLTHTTPKALSGGKVSFSFSWTAPNEPGAVRFDVSTLVGNGNGGSSGDGGDQAYFDFVYGCTPATYYRDFDADGFGVEGVTRIHCVDTVPSGYSRAAGDCDDSRSTIYPDAVEVCNQLDDDCDTVIDDEAIPVALYPDADGDGYYSHSEFESGEMITGCVGEEGWAAEPNDCVPADPTINPGMEEICNLVDDNCDGRIDEYVRPRCGEGSCEREALTCDAETCTPGEPTAEECNLLDDDCDATVDEGTLCPDGSSCVAAGCGGLVEEPTEPPGEATPTSSGCTIGVTNHAWLHAAWLLMVVGLLDRRASARKRARRSPSPSEISKVDPTGPGDRVG